MKKFKLQRVVPYLLITSMLLTGCGKKTDCNLPTRHVHLYTKDINNEITISKYLDSEYEQTGGYNWNEDYIEITKVDEELYKTLQREGLFDAMDNWDYLYYLMANSHDWLEFYYEYDTTETYTETDSKGNVTVHTRTVHHDGWHKDPRDYDNTGKTRLYHLRFYAYRVNYVNGKFVLERSPLVDDIREVIGEYPYANENCYEKVYETFKFKRNELPYLRPEDFDTFDHPDLSNTTPYLGQVKTK